MCAGMSVDGSERENSWEIGEESISEEIILFGGRSLDSYEIVLNLFFSGVHASVVCTQQKLKIIVHDRWRFPAFCDNSRSYLATKALISADDSIV